MQPTSMNTTLKKTLTAGGVSLLAAGSIFATSPSASAADVWDRVAQCESGGNWSIATGNGYFGGLQFSQSSWQAAGGSGNPAAASKEEQKRVARNLLQLQGPGAWPVCSKKAGLTRANGGAVENATTETAKAPLAPSEASHEGYAEKPRTMASSQAPTPPRHATYGTYSVSHGMPKVQVRRLQQTLGATMVDGVVGPETVRLVQVSAGLPRTGSWHLTGQALAYAWQLL